MSFAGFSPALIQFLGELRAHNTREWFQAHREQYEDYLLEPARQFVTAMGECLRAVGSDIHAEAKVHGSIFAINRDTRFSADKTPYKTYLDLWFWQGDGPSRERPGYFFRLQPESLILGAGMHSFPDAALQRYRAAVGDVQESQRLEAAAASVTSSGASLGGQTLKRVPAGLIEANGHTPPKRADWLRHTGLFAQCEVQPLPHETFTPDFAAFCTERYQRLAPLQQWLVGLLQS